MGFKERVYSLTGTIIESAGMDASKDLMDMVRNSIGGVKFTFPMTALWHGIKIITNQ